MAQLLCSESSSVPKARPLTDARRIFFFFHWREKSIPYGKNCLFFGFLCFSVFLVKIARFGIRKVFLMEFLHPVVHTFSGVVFDPKKFYCCERWGSPPRFLSTTPLFTATARPVVADNALETRVRWLMGRLAVSVHQESPRSASIWARTRIFPNSKHGKIFFLEMN